MDYDRDDRGRTARLASALFLFFLTPTGPGPAQGRRREGSTETRNNKKGTTGPAGGRKSSRAGDRRQEADAGYPVIEEQRSWP